MGELPKGWISKLLGEIATNITKGTTPTTVGYSFQNEGIPFIKVENIEKNKVDHSTIYQFISNKAHKALSRSAFEVGDVLFSIAGTIGKTALIEEADLPCNTNQAIAIIRGTSHVLLPSYLKFNLSYRAQEIFRENARGGAMNNVSLGDLKKTKIAIPPLPEQKRIVAKLDEVLAQVDTIKARLDSIPELLKRFRQSVLASAVSGKLTEEWRKHHSLEPASESLKSISTAREKIYLSEIEAGNKNTKRLLTKVKKHNPTLPSDILPTGWEWTSFMASMERVVDCHNKTAPYIDEGIPLIRTPDIRNGKITLTGAMYISEETYDYWSRRCPPASGDIIFTREAPMGEAGIVPEDVKLCMGQRMMLLRPMPKYIEPKYVLLNILSLSFQERMESQAIGTGVKHLRVADVESLSYPLAPIEEQKEIVRLVDQYFAFADSIETQVKKAQARVDNLTQSILAKAFRGELVPQDPNDEPADKLLERIQQARAEAEALAKTAKKAATAKKRSTQKKS